MKFVADIGLDRQIADLDTLTQMFFTALEPLFGADTYWVRGSERCHCNWGLQLDGWKVALEWQSQKARFLRKAVYSRRLLVSIGGGWHKQKGWYLTVTIHDSRIPSSSIGEIVKAFGEQVRVVEVVLVDNTRTIDKALIASFGNPPWAETMRVRTAMARLLSLPPTDEIRAALRQGEGLLAQMEGKALLSTQERLEEAHRVFQEVSQRVLAVEELRESSEAGEIEA